MRSIVLGVGLVFVVGGCGSSPAAPIDAGRDAPPRPDAPRPPIDAGPATVLSGGDVSGDWCGYFHVTGDVRVPSGSTLTICAGSIVELDPSVGITVEGTLVIAGTDLERVTLARAGAAPWDGLAVSGALEADFTDLSGAATGVAGLPGSALRMDDSMLVDCGRGFNVENGGTFDRTTVRRGATNNVRGGILRMTDSVIDLEHPEISPDCTDTRGGGMVFDHVRITGCHCPMHIVSADLETTVTNSILDGAVNPVMIADCVATFHGNHFLGTSSMLDIGSDGGITADVAGNYWGGDEPNVSSPRLSQFSGMDEFETAPIGGVGPRP